MDSAPDLPDCFKSKAATELSTPPEIPQAIRRIPFINAMSVVNLTFPYSLFCHYETVVCSLCASSKVPNKTHMVSTSAYNKSTNVLNDFIGLSSPLLLNCPIKHPLIYTFGSIVWACDRVEMKRKASQIQLLTERWF